MPEGKLDKIVSLNLPEYMIEFMAILVKLGYFPSRSELIRQVLYTFLVKEQNIKDDLLNFEEMKEKQMKLEILS